MEFYFPTEMNEQVAFIGCAATAVIGLLIFLFPGTVLRLSAFQVGEVRPEGYGSVRAVGGRYIGLGILPILLAQDWFYMATGVVLALGAAGRLVSFFIDRGVTPRNIVFFLLEVALSAAPLAYVFGYI
ncbi:membrane protein [Neorhizobium sp. NCHU2750]|nr:membrane protein [Neorhizobium sp. NCHU2750]